MHFNSKSQFKITILKLCETFECSAFHYKILLSIKVIKISLIKCDLNSLREKVGISLI